MEDTIRGVGTIIIGGFFLFLLIASAVKMAVREVLYEFKEDIVKEFNLKNTNTDNKDDK
jgi:hypothetical protein